MALSLTPHTSSSYTSDLPGKCSEGSTKGATVAIRYAGNTAQAAACVLAFRGRGAWGDCQPATRPQLESSCGRLARSQCRPVILRMMEPCADRTAKPVWFVSIRVDSLRKLPQLHAVVTQNREYGKRL